VKAVENDHGQVDLLEVSHQEGDKAGEFQFLKQSEILALFQYLNGGVQWFCLLEQIGCLPGNACAIRFFDSRNLGKFDG
jgi:hypothetical protein